MTVIKVTTSTEKKSDGSRSCERRLYVAGMEGITERFSRITRRHWSIESMHWCLDRNLRQDDIKRKTERATRNLDTLQRMVLALVSIWRNRRKKKEGWHWSPSGEIEERRKKKEEIRQATTEQVRHNCFKLDILELPGICCPATE